MAAVIAILAALLLPLLTTANQKAVSTACLSNLKQLQIAFQTYTDDHNGHVEPWRWKAEKNFEPRTS